MRTPPNTDLGEGAVVHLAVREVKRVVEILGRVSGQVRKRVTDWGRKTLRKRMGHGSGQWPID